MFAEAGETPKVGRFSQKLHIPAVSEGFAACSERIADCSEGFAACSEGFASRSEGFAECAERIVSCSERIADCSERFAHRSEGCADVSETRADVSESRADLAEGRARRAARVRALKVPTLASKKVLRRGAGGVYCARCTSPLLPRRLTDPPQGCPPRSLALPKGEAI